MIVLSLYIAVLAASSLIYTRYILSSRKITFPPLPPPPPILEDDSPKPEEKPKLKMENFDHV